jgi:hypothetical protein
VYEQWQQQYEWLTSVPRRSLVRSALYTSALVAIQHNPVISAFYQKLLLAGKAKKLALIACAHKSLKLKVLIDKSQLGLSRARSYHRFLF